MRGVLKLKVESGNTKKVQTGAKNFFSSYGIYFVLILMVGILSIISPAFFTVQNIINVLRQISINGILAIGVTLIIVTGGIDLSLGSILALAGVVATNHAHPEPYYPLALIILMGIAVGALCGLVNGSIVAYSRVSPFIVTLGMMTVARGVTFVYTDGRPIIKLTKEYQYIGQGVFLGIPLPIYILLFIGIVGFVILHKSKYGRHIYAIGGNEMAAKVSGINVARIKLFVYTFAGALCGLAGIMLASRTNAATPNAGSGYELDAIAAAVLGGTSTSGGRGTIYGTIVGVLIMGVLSNGLDILNVSSYIQQIVKGVIIVGAVWVDQMNTT